MQDIKQNLAIAVREARTELGLSQEKLAESLIWISAPYSILKQDVAILNLKSCIP